MNDAWPIARAQAAETVSKNAVLPRASTNLPRSGLSGHNGITYG